MTFEEPVPAVYQRLIDRLATGDLDEHRRRELLNWLDERPTRWRRCGLAFLEAQTWNEALGASGDVERTVVRTDAPKQHRAASIAIRLALAAAVLAAFGLGIVARSLWPLGRAETLA